MTKWTQGAILILLVMSLTGLASACGGSDSNDTLDAYLLVDELRQSSDDLTRMARLNSVTGEDRFRDYFQRILDIRNGVVARPANPNSAYWDIAIATGEMPPTDGKTAALSDLLEDAGLSSQQLDLVKTAQERSDSLASLETEAFEGSREEAVGILHGAEYNRLKAEIMRPINQLLESLLNR